MNFRGGLYHCAQVAFMRGEIDVIERPIMASLVIIDDAYYVPLVTKHTSIDDVLWEAVVLTGELDKKRIDGNATFSAALPQRDLDEPELEGLKRYSFVYWLQDTRMLIAVSPSCTMEDIWSGGDNMGTSVFWSDPRPLWRL